MVDPAINQTHFFGAIQVSAPHWGAAVVSLPKRQRWWRSSPRAGWVVVSGNPGETSNPKRPTQKKRIKKMRFFFERTTPKTIFVWFYLYLSPCERGSAECADLYVSSKPTSCKVDRYWSAVSASSNKRFHGPRFARYQNKAFNESTSNERVHVTWNLSNCYRFNTHH